MKKRGIFSERFVENAHICKILHKFHVEQGFCQYQDWLTKSLHTVSVLTKRFLLSILSMITEVQRTSHYTLDSQCSVTKCK